MQKNRLLPKSQVLKRTQNQFLKRIFQALFVLAFLFAGQSLSAQSKIRDKKISVYAENEQIESVLNKISKKGSFYFSYNSDLVATQPKVSIQATNKPISEILDELFAQKVTTIETGNYLILRKKDNIQQKKEQKPKQKTKYQITGYIYNTKTGEKLSNTTIYQIGQTKSVLTDLNGYYSLWISTKNDNIGLAFTKNEYKDTVIVIEPATQALTIGLIPEEKVLVVIEAKGIDTDTAKVALEELPIVKFAVPKKQFKLSEN